MGQSQQALKVEPARWGDEAETVLASAVYHVSIGELKSQYKRGAKLFKVSRENGQTVGFYLLRIDKNADGCEGVLVAAAGKDLEFDLTAAVLPVIEGQFIGCAVLRIHTARPGLAKKLAAVGYEPQEIVLRKVLR
jgi:hypothetical protein